MLAEENGDVLAIVNGVVITKAQFYELLETECSYYALQELVQKELVRQRPMPCRSVSMKKFTEVWFHHCIAWRSQAADVLIRTM